METLRRIPPVNDVLRSDELAEFREILDNYVAQKYGAPEPVAYAESG